METFKIKHDKAGRCARIKEAMEQRLVQRCDRNKQRQARIPLHKATRGGPHIKSKNAVTCKKL
jgi:hypothetical protein